MENSSTTPDYPRGSVGELLERRRRTAKKFNFNRQLNELDHQLRNRMLAIVDSAPAYVRAQFLDELRHRFPQINWDT